MNSARRLPAIGCRAGLAPGMAAVPRSRSPVRPPRRAAVGGLAEIECASERRTALALDGTTCTI
jgi:hypothetical protein